MNRIRMPLAALLPFALAGCLAPGADIQPAPGDFAFLEIQLQG